MSFSPTHFSWQSLACLNSELNLEELGAAEICARYVLLHLHSRHRSQWLSSPRSPKSTATHNADSLIALLKGLEVSLSTKQAARLAGLKSVHDLYSSFFFRGVVLDSHEGLLGWMESRYPLRLRLDIPTPNEMLDVQCQGLRYVSLQLEPEMQFKSFGRHADACDFLLHDFEHAHKFFADPENHRGQVRFFQRLKSSLAEFARWESDPLFVKDLDYLKSDMNSHPVHLTKYLKAVVLSAEMRKTGLRRPELDGFWGDLFARWGFKGDSLSAALKVNCPEQESQDDLIRVAEVFHVH